VFENHDENSKDAFFRFSGQFMNTKQSNKRIEYKDAIMAT
jgi:hypothetical protein